MSEVANFYLKLDIFNALCNAIVWGAIVNHNAYGYRTDIDIGIDLSTFRCDAKFSFLLDFKKGRV